MEGGDAQRGRSGTLEVSSGPGADRCAVEVLGPSAVSVSEGQAQWRRAGKQRRGSVGFKSLLPRRVPTGGR